jgi:hypothetical protein
MDSAKIVGGIPEVKRLSGRWHGRMKTYLKRIGLYGID